MLATYENPRDIRQFPRSLPDRRDFFGTYASPREVQPTRRGAVPAKVQKFYRPAVM
jgi:hypothetical protein